MQALQNQIEITEGINCAEGISKLFQCVFQGGVLYKSLFRGFEMGGSVLFHTRRLFNHS